MKIIFKHQHPRADQQRLYRAFLISSGLLFLAITNVWSGPAITATQNSCVAPCSVYFDAMGDQTWEEIGNRKFEWDFGVPLGSDQSSGGKTFVGFQAAHVYETPGNYTVSLKTYQDNLLIDTKIHPITVTPFNGRTICVSPSGNWGGCPADSSADHFTDLSTAWNQIRSNTRVLLERGKTFAGTPPLNSGHNGPVLIGVYPLVGAGKAKIQWSGTPTNFLSVNHSDWRIQDIILDGNTSVSGVNYDHMVNALFLRVELPGNHANSAFGSGAAVDYGDMSGLFIVDSQVDTGDHYSFQGGGSKFALLNSSFQNGEDANSNVRIRGVDQLLIAGCRIRENSGNADWSALIIRGGDDRAGSRNILVSGNIFGASIVFDNGGNPKTRTDSRVIVENNLLHCTKTNLSGIYQGITAECTNCKEPFVLRDVVIRNNIISNMRTGINTADHNNIKIYNNTYYLGISDECNVFSSRGANVLIQNNLAYSVSLAGNPCTFMNAGSGVTASNNIGYFPFQSGQCRNATGQNTCTDPDFLSLNLSNPDFLKIGSNSPANNAGTPIMGAFSDITGNFRPSGSGYDIGAHEYGTGGTTPPPPVNQAPAVDAGSDQTVAISAGADLNGMVSDDGKPNPPGQTTVQWSAISGPGAVNFLNSQQAHTRVDFPAPGEYVLRLTANDGALSASDDVRITVTGSSNESPLPKETAFLPFNPVLGLNQAAHLVIPFSISESGPVEMTLYDRKGREIRKVYRGDLNAGQYESVVTWHGQNEEGSLVSAGSYTLVMKAGGKTFKKKVVVIK